MVDKDYPIQEFDYVRNDKIFCEKSIYEKLISEYGNVAKIEIEKRIKFYQCKPFETKEKKLYLEKIKEFIILINPEGKTEEEIYQIEKKKELPEKELTRTELNLKSFSDLEKLKINKSFIVQNLILPDSLTMLYSPPAEFKSLISLYLAVCVSSGKDFLGLKTKKCSVLYCDKENSPNIILERWKKLRVGLNLRKKNFPLFMLLGNGSIFEKGNLNIGFQELMNRAVEKHKIKLIVFDTLHRFGDFDENSANDVNNIFVKFFSPLIQKGISIIFLHHTSKGKNEDYRGSGDLLGAVTSAYKINKNQNKFSLTAKKIRDVGISELFGEFEFLEKAIYISPLNAVVEKAISKDKLIGLTDKIRSFFHEGERWKPFQIKDKLKFEKFEFSNSTFKRALDYLIQSKFLDKNAKGEYWLII